MSDLIRTLRETAHYPPHPPRKPTALYNRTHEKLIKHLDRPCLVCGVRDSTLRDPAANRYGATALETHHYIIEDSLINAVDLAKFNAKVRPGLRRRAIQREMLVGPPSGDVGAAKAKYDHDFTQAEMEEWAHGDEDAMWVLCDIHHRHPLVGIHAITYPIWAIQDLLIEGYDLTGFQAHSPSEAAALLSLPNTIGVPASPPSSASP